MSLTAIDFTVSSESCGAQEVTWKTKNDHYKRIDRVLIRKLSRRSQTCHRIKACADGTERWHKIPSNRRTRNIQESMQTKSRGKCGPGAIRGQSDCGPWWTPPQRNGNTLRGEGFWPRNGNGNAMKRRQKGVVWVRGFKERLNPRTEWRNRLGDGGVGVQAEIYPLIWWCLILIATVCSVLLFISVSIWFSVMLSDSVWGPILFGSA